MFKLFGSRKHSKGPDWSKAKEHYLDLSGTKIYFKTPPNNNPDVPFETQPEIYDLYDANIFFQTSYLSKQSSEMEGGYSEDWQYTGFPLFGQIGSLSLGIGVVHNPEFGSLNNPDNFVAAINQHINYTSGPLSRYEKGYYSHIRKNWFIQSLGDTPFVHYERHVSHALHSMRFWNTQISDEHYMYIVFNKLISYKNTNLDQAYDELIDKILSTIRIEWSADAVKQQIEAKAKWPDQKLPESLPELTWSDEEWRANETDYQRQQREFAEKVEATNIKLGDFNA
jgi:hypothetical protein